MQRISCNDASKLQVGQAQYSGLLTPQGTFVDDLLVYRLAPQHFLLVVNASHIATDYAHIAEHIKPAGDAVAVDASSRYALLAVQGPRALEVLQPLTGVDLGVAEVLLVRARRGGERPRDDLAHRLHRRGRLRDLRAAAVGRPRLAGAPRGRASRSDLIPCGLGARDTLRLEAAMRLYGNDIDETTTALEADLGWIVGWKKGDFIGAEALRQQKAAGVTRKLVGFEMLDRGIARQGHDVVRRRRAGRRGDERHADAVSEEGDRHGVPAGRAHRPPAPSSTSTSAAAARAPRVVPMPFYKRHE